MPKSAVAQLSESVVPQYDVATPDLNKLQTKAETSIKNGTPLKVAVVMPLQLTTDNAGIWERTTDGYNIWRLKLHNANALGCCALFDHFDLPEGAQFFAYNNDKSLIYGPYTREDNPSGEGYSSGLFPEGDVILEYVSPRHQFNQTETPNITINGYTYFYRSEGLPDLRVSEAKDGDTGYGASQSCMINVNCSEGDNWRIQQKGVGRMLGYVVEDGQLGAGWCSGTLINNTMGDGTAYFLSANHCSSVRKNAPLIWRWRNYSASSPDSPLATYTSHKTIQSTIKLLAIHRDQELLVATSVLHFVFQESHGFQRGHIRQLISQNPYFLQHFLGLQQVVTTRT